MVDATLALPADTRLMVLAPVVRDRKGEFADLFADMQAQGYVRFRVDGTDGRGRRRAEAEEGREARHRRRHRPRQACQPGIAAAPGRELRGGAAHRRRRARIALEIGTSRRAEHLFSSKFACPLCSYSLSELEPRLFSFNSPVGACPTCDGLGADDGVRRRPRGRLPVAQPGQRRGQGLGPAQRLHLLAARERRRATTASTSTPPFEELPEPARQVLLHGSGSEEIEFVYEAEGARGKTRAGQAQASVRRHPAQPRAPLQARPIRSRCART